VGPIPEELWAAAASCAAECGSYQTARVLGLDSGKLKRKVSPGSERKVAPGSRRPRKGSVSRPAFVEVATPARSAARAECVLEVENPAVCHEILEFSARDSAILPMRQDFGKRN
jgi:hypothetical protein